MNAEKLKKLSYEYATEHSDNVAVGTNNFFNEKELYRAFDEMQMELHVSQEENRRLKDAISNLRSQLSACYEIKGMADEAEEISKRTEETAKKYGIEK